MKALHRCSIHAHAVISPYWSRCYDVAEHIPIEGIGKYSGAEIVDVGWYQAISEELIHDRSERRSLV